MWGNTRGWIISIILTVLMGAALARSAMPYSSTPPTHDPAVAIALQPVALPTPPTDLVAADQPCDAADNYLVALESYQSNPTPYDTFRTPASLSRLPQVPALDLILKATHCAGMNLFRTRPAQVVSYYGEHPQLDQIRKLGELTLAVGVLYRRDKNYPDADRYLDAGFSLGAHLFQERVTFEEMSSGLGLMHSAVDEMKAVAKDRGDASAMPRLDAFEKQLSAYGQKQLDAYRIVGAVDEDFAGKYAGDILEIAGDSKADTMWRVEAIKHIGHYQYSSQSRGDQVKARLLLQKLASATDVPPAIHTAATEARDLTIEQHRSTR